MTRRLTKRPRDEAIIKALYATGGMIARAAEKLGIDYTTLYKYLRQTPELKDVVMHIRESQLDLAETKLLENIKEGKEASIFFYLKCKAQERGYIEKQQIEHTGTIKAVQYYLPQPKNALTQQQENAIPADIVEENEDE